MRQIMSGFVMLKNLKEGPGLNRLLRFARYDERKDSRLYRKEKIASGQVQYKHGNEK